MDLSHVMDNESREAKEVDMVEVVMDTEEFEENSMDAESAVNTVMGLVDMSEVVGSMSTTDAESMTDATLSTFRAGVASLSFASALNSKEAFGIDTESAPTIPSAAYVRDVEGIQEFFKKIWEKIKRGLIKANAFFRKTFLKFLNLVSFRKGTLETLIEDVEGATSGNETLKASKFSIVKKFAGSTGVLNGDKQGEDIDISKLTVDVLFPEAVTDVLNKTVSDSVNALKEMMKIIDKKDTELVTEDFVTITKAMDAASKLESFGKKDDTSILSILDATSKKLFNNMVRVFVVRSAGTNVYVFGVNKNAKIDTTRIKINTKNIKNLINLKSDVLIPLLKKAEEINNDFKTVVDNSFEAYDNAEIISDVFSGVNLEKLNGDEKKIFKKIEIMGKNMVSKTPWIAYHTAMHQYKQVGYIIGLGKAYLKDVKEDK